MEQELNEIKKNLKQMEIKSVIRDVPNFPKEGITFKDITPLLAHPSLRKAAFDSLIVKIIAENRILNFDAIAGVESRGFLFGMALAERLSLPFVPIRKAGKLPFHKISQSYDLEYGTATIEMHTDAITPGQRVLIHDDLFATGGTVGAAGELIRQLGGEVAAFVF